MNNEEQQILLEILDAIRAQSVLLTKHMLVQEAQHQMIQDRLDRLIIFTNPNRGHLEVINELV